MKALSVAAMAFCVPSLAIAAGVRHPTDVKSSAELLAEGFRPIADGDLLGMTTVFREDPMWTGYFSHDDDGYGGIVSQAFDTFVRLKRNSEEFVCILAKTDQCYRADFVLGGR